MALAEDAMISHHSALHFHGLTDQIPSRVYVSVSVGNRAPSPSGGSTVRAGDFKYRFVRLTPERHFGGVQRWVGESKVTFTDPERTLLDGISRPGYCGDFGEVLNAFRGARSAIDIPKICEYALRLDDATAKRLGWILQESGCDETELEPLRALQIRGYRNLDPEGPNEGPHDSRWMIRVNLPGRISP